MMEQQINDLKKALETYGINVYEDELAEDEADALFNSGEFHCFVYETKEIVANNDKKSYSQQILVYYYSERMDDLDTRAIDIIEKVEAGTKLIEFQRTLKDRLQKKDTDRYVDRIVFVFNRRIKKRVVCP